MSYQTWSTNGYGFCVSNIKTDKEKVLKLIKTELKDFYKKHQQEINSGELTLDKFLILISCQYGIGDEVGEGLSILLQSLIKTQENIPTCVVNDFEDNWFILYMPTYPWDIITEKEKNIKSKEEIKNIFIKHIKTLTNSYDENSIDFWDVANGG